MTGTGLFSLQDVETYLSLSASFCARCSVSTPADAKRRIYYGESELPPSLEAGATLAPLRPFCILVPESLNYNPEGVGDSIQYAVDGGVVAIFQDNPRFKEDYKLSLNDFYGWVSQILDEISATHRTDQYMRFRMRMISPPYRPQLSARGSDDFWEAGFLFTFGDP
ncbi:MAG: hypothetical protein ACO1RA_02285 [Planctomycetaceae bacterium]